MVRAILFPSIAWAGHSAPALREDRAFHSIHGRGRPRDATTEENPTSLVNNRTRTTFGRTPNPFDFPSSRRYSYAQIDNEVLELREYEIVFVVRPDLADEDRSTKVEQIHSLITENGGELGKVEDWGKRVLAYEIRHNTEGYYGLAEFRLPPSSVRTVEDRLNIDEEILRYQIISRS